MFTSPVCGGLVGMEFEHKQKSMGIHPLTSTIWAMAAVGMVVGIGYAGARMALSLLVLGVVALLSVWERRFIDAGRPSWARVTFRADGGKTLIKLRKALEAHSFARNKYALDVARQPEAASEASLVQRSAHAQMRIRYSDSRRVHREFLF